jgi:glucan-binding YG repeat protein
MKTNWIFDKNYNKWYYLDENGVMKKGWVKVQNEWYYMNSTGAMQTGWIKDNGKDYLLYSNGVMAHDITIYGYKIDNNGVAIKA